MTDDCAICGKGPDAHTERYYGKDSDGHLVEMYGTYYNKDGQPSFHYYLPVGNSMADNKIDRTVDYPAHYGGADDPYEAIKVIEAWGLGFCLGNTLKYIRRAGSKGELLEDLKKAAWYLNREIERLEKS